MPFSLATFNVKDLLDAEAPMWRDKARREAKLSCLAATIVAMDADVVALQEVGSASALAELQAHLPRTYLHAAAGTADARGIGCALLSRRPLLKTAVHTKDDLTFPRFSVGDGAPFTGRLPLRRGILYAQVEAGALGAVDVLVAHFKSNRPVPLRDARGEAKTPRTAKERAEGHVRSLVWRVSEALFVRGLVDALLEESPARHVAVAGDLNDGAHSLSVRAIRSEGEASLAACAERVPLLERFSVLRRGERLQIDHLLVTRGLAQRLAHARFVNESLRDHGDQDDAAPPATDSDHAPLVAVFDD